MTGQAQPTDPAKPMTVDEFLVWAAAQPGRYELVGGEVVAMSPQRARHALVKHAAQTALSRAIERAGLPCEMMPDRMTVRIDATTAFEPDALVYCGPPIDLESVEVPAPVIVVEVLSPGTKHVDTGLKLAGYFRVPSVMHYLIVDPRRRLVIHHKRGEGALIETRIGGEGSLDLVPPGLGVPIAELFSRA